MMNMLKKTSKKSWKKHNGYPCEPGCFICEGNWFARFINRTRVRNKFFKYPQKIYENES
jgi:hypothetical protein